MIVDRSSDAPGQPLRSNLQFLNRKVLHQSSCFVYAIFVFPHPTTTSD